MSQTTVTDADRDLIARAIEARSRARAGWSGFRVGAALRASDGRIFAGCNIESATFGLTLCAERTALFSAWGEGVTEVESIAVVVPDGQPGLPCGICRQMLAEMTPDVRVIVRDPDGTLRVRTVDDLLPDPGGSGEERDRAR